MSYSSRAYENKLFKSSSIERVARLIRVEQILINRIFSLQHGNQKWILV